MKSVKYFAYAAIAITSHAAMAANVAIDSASNSAYGDGWQNGDNGGSGFGAWTLNATGSGGTYVGTTGQGNPSFGLFSGLSGTATASRLFTGGALGVGQTFSINLGHTANIATNNDIGLLLTDGGITVFTLKFFGGGTDWLLNDGGLDFGSGQAYAPNTSLAFSFTYEGSNKYSYTFGTGSGTSFTATSDISGIDGFTLFNNNQGSGENLGANNMAIIPEPSAALLSGLGALALLRRRRF